MYKTKFYKLLQNIIIMTAIYLYYVYSNLIHLHYCTLTLLSHVNTSYNKLYDNSLVIM